MLKVAPEEIEEEECGKIINVLFPTVIESNVNRPEFY